MSPAASLTMSPGTSSASGISWAVPSRITVAVTLIMALSFAAASSARASCTNRKTTPSTTMLNITQPGRDSPVANETDANKSNKNHQRIHAGLQKQHDPAVPLLLGDHVRAVLFQPLLDFLGRQPALPGFELFENRPIVAARRLDHRGRNLNLVPRPLQQREDVFR